MVDSNKEVFIPIAKSKCALPTPSILAYLGLKMYKCVILNTCEAAFRLPADIQILIRLDCSLKAAKGYH